MGSPEVKVNSLVRKKTLHLKAKKAEVKSLNAIVKESLRRDQRVVFRGKYGNLLELLQVDVQEEAITALAQFYDPPYTCFTFRDFQLAPTLEEFGLILGYPLKDGQPPYLSIGHSPRIETIANVLKVSEENLREKNNKDLKNGLIRRKYLEDHLRGLAEKEEWRTFMDVLALTIYGVVLFPNSDSMFVDMAAIDVFLAYTTRGENPMPAVLANVYYTMNYCHKAKGKRILCCLPALYVWLTSHVFKIRSYNNATSPIDDHETYPLETKSGGDQWAQILIKLNETTVRWCPTYQKDVETVIYQCGNFPNVPLIGTKGCVSYNPCLALRQLGYPIIEPPTDHMVTPLFNIYKDDPSWAPKVQRAWVKIIRKGKKELGKRCTNATEVYRQWVKNMVQSNGLPFYVASSSGEEAAAPIPPFDDTEEVKELKDALARAKVEKEKMRMELVEVHRAYETEQRKNLQIMKSLEDANKRASEEEKCKKRTQSCLRASDTALKKYRKLNNIAQAKVFHLKESLRSSEASKRDMKDKLENLQQQLEMQKRIQD